MTNEEAIKILGNVSIDYTGMNQEEIDQIDEALTLAFNAMSILHKSNPELEWIKAQEERIEELEKELEESRAKEGKGAFETALESFGQLVANLNEALQGLTSEEIRELLRQAEEEEDDD